MEKLYINKEDCCGCSACLNICPKHAIYMKHDEKGYLYPEIRKDSCVNCGLCEKVCPLKEKEKNKKFEKIAYGVKNKDEHERAKSSSGGVFAEVAKYILNNDGVVYGVEMNNDFQVKHGRATTIEDARKFQGSKYVQSDKHSIFCMVQKDLKEGKEVLFTGTPCEVAGLKKYLRKEYDNLYTLDLICHGVPSSELLNAFLKGKEKLYSSQIIELKFREKVYGWRNQEIYIKFKNGRIYHAPIWVDNFYRLFTNNYILRDSCYACRFSSMERQGDITIGDFWNLKNVNEAFEDKLGVSSVIINSEKGEKVFETLKNKFDIIECSLNEINQKNLNSPSPKPYHYEEFQRMIEKKGFEYCLKKYGSMKMLEKIRRVLSPVKQRLKAMLRH